MRVLLTGDTGFIGGNMKTFLLSHGIEVEGCSRRNGCDILDEPMLRDRAQGCDLVYHFAANARPGESVLDPVRTIEQNIKGALNVLETCRMLGLPLVYPSSCEVYGDSQDPIGEEFPMRPPNPYSVSKAAIDRICYTYYKCYSLDVKSVRLFNPYGSHQQLDKIIPTFYRQAISNEPITVFGDGNDTRDYVYIEDIIKGLWLARELCAGEVVNLATGKATTSFEVAQAVKEYTGSESPIVFIGYPAAFGGIRHQVGSYERAANLIGWEPRIPLNEGLQRTMDWLKDVVQSNES